MSRKYASRTGLTFVEVILVASLISMIALTLFNALSNGLKVWSRINKFVVEEDIALFFEDITQEIRNSFAMENMGFEGGLHKIAFPSVLLTQQDPSLTAGRTNYVYQPGRVRYVFDTAKKSLYRQDANYSLATDNKFFGKREVLRSVKDVQFHFFTMSEERLQELGETQIWPIFVRIVVIYGDPSGTQHVMEKSIALPLYSAGNV